MVSEEEERERMVCDEREPMLGYIFESNKRCDWEMQIIWVKRSSLLATISTDDELRFVVGSNIVLWGQLGTCEIDLGVVKIILDLRQTHIANEN